MSAGTAYAKRYGSGFLNLPIVTTPIDATFLNAVETALAQLLGSAPTADGQVAQWDFANTRFGPALLLNKNVDPAAAIAYSKLNLAASIVNADIAAGALIASTKLDINYATTLPGAPSDKQLAILVDSITAPTYEWLFRYNAGSASTYKWEFLGGTPLTGFVSTQQTATTTGWQDLATVGPSVTVPRAGDYDICYGARFITGTGAQSMYMGVKVGAIAIGPMQMGTGVLGGGSILQDMFMSQSSTFFGDLRSIAASTVLKAQYYVATADGPAYNNRQLSVTPTRVI